MTYIKALLCIIALSSSCTTMHRNPANIFDRDDREALKLSEVAGVGRLMKDPNDKYLWGTAFHLSNCHIASAYHVVKDTNTQMTKEDEVFFISALDEEPIKATPVAWGRPYEENLNENDWVILKLEKCVDLKKEDLFTLMNYKNIDELRGRAIQLFGFPEDKMPTNIHLDRNCKFGDERPKPEEGIGHNCATRPGNSGGPLFYLNSNSQREVAAIAVASRGYFVEIIVGYSPWIANTATPVKPIKEAFQSILSQQ